MTPQEIQNEQNADIADDDGLMTYESIWANVVISEELIVTVAAEDVPALRVGIKNVKGRQAAQSRADGMPPVAGTLLFSERPSVLVKGAVEVTITLSQKGAIKVLATRVPDGNF